MNGYQKWILINIIILKVLLIDVYIKMFYLIFVKAMKLIKINNDEKSSKKRN